MALRFHLSLASVRPRVHAGQRELHQGPGFEAPFSAHRRGGEVGDSQVEKPWCSGVPLLWPMPGVAHLVEKHKRAFRDLLITIAAEAGAADPTSLGRQLAVIYEGAAALSASCNDALVIDDARHAAATVIRAALGD